MAFSLIELIGILAVLVIVASLLLPRILHSSKTVRVVEGVNNARVADALAAVRAVQTAAVEHYARFGSLASRSGVAFPVAASYDKYDAILLSEQLLDRPFAVKLGSGAIVRLVNVSALSASTGVDGSGGAYDLDGRGNNSISGASHVLEAVVSGVTEPEAKALNDGLDGPALGASLGEADRRGRVAYAAFPQGALGQVCIYIIHH